MDDAIYEEIKGLINAAVSEQAKSLHIDMKANFAAIDKKFGKIHRHLGYMQNFIGSTLDTSVHATDAVLSDHEARLFDIETDGDTSKDIGLFTSVNRQFYNMPERTQLVP